MTYRIRIIVIIFLAAITACESPRNTEEEQSRSVRSIYDVQNEFSEVVMSLPGVVGTAIGLTETGQEAILVFLAEDIAETRKKIPESVEGYPVIIQVTGELEPMRKSP